MINQFKIGRPDSKSMEMHRSVTGRIGCEKLSWKAHESVPWALVEKSAVYRILSANSMFNYRMSA